MGGFSNRITSVTWAVTANHLPCHRSCNDVVVCVVRSHVVEAFMENCNLLLTVPTGWATDNQRTASLTSHMYRQNKRFAIQCQYASDYNYQHITSDTGGWKLLLLVASCLRVTMIRDSQLFSLIIINERQEKKTQFKLQGATEQTKHLPKLHPCQCHLHFYLFQKRSSGHRHTCHSWHPVGWMARWKINKITLKDSPVMFSEKVDA